MYRTQDACGFGTEAPYQGRVGKMEETEAKRLEQILVDFCIKHDLWYKVERDGRPSLDMIKFTEICIKVD